jgi:hypothetical protein
MLIGVLQVEHSMRRDSQFFPAAKIMPLRAGTAGGLSTSAGTNTWDEVGLHDHVEAISLVQ